MNKLCLADSLIRISEEKGKNLKDLSRDLKIPYTTLYSWSLNRSPRNWRALKALANYAGTSIDHLLFGNPEEGMREKRSLDMDPNTSQSLVGCFEVRIRRIEGQK